MNKELLAMVMPEPTEAEIRKACQDKREELGFDAEKALFPVNPLEIEPSISVDDAVILAGEFASVWDSVWDSVRDSVWDSVWDSVRDSIGDSIGASVRASVRASIGASVWAYESSIYFGITEWKGVDHKAGENPFQPAITLWEAGYISSFDGKTTRLHTKNGIVWEGVLNKEG